MAGSSNVEIEVKEEEQEKNLPKEQKVSDKYVQIVSLPDGSKQIQFNFPHLGNKKAQTKPELNQIYVEIVNILQTKTNFNLLLNQADYLMAIARLLEAAYFGLEKVDANAQGLFDKLTNELEIKEEEEEDKEILQSTDSDGGQSDKSLQSGSSDDENDQSADISQGSNEPKRDQTAEEGSNDQQSHYATSQDFSEGNEPIQELGTEEVKDKRTNTFHLNLDNNYIENSENNKQDNSEIQNNMQETSNDKSGSSGAERTQNLETNTDIKDKPHRTNDEL